MFFWGGVFYKLMIFISFTLFLSRFFKSGIPFALSNSSEENMRASAIKQDPNKNTLQIRDLLIMKNVAKSKLNQQAGAIGVEQQLSATELAFVTGGVVVIKPPVRDGGVSLMHIGDGDGPIWIKE